MLKSIVSTAYRNWPWTFALFCFMGASGLWALKKLPIDAVPDITNVQVVINSQTGALDPGKIEKLVSYPIETEMTGMPGVEEVRSLSKYGLSQVVVIFQEGTDLYFSRQLVAEKLQSVRSGLPEGVSPEMAPVTTGLGEVLMYVVEPKEGSTLARATEKERLLRTRDVQDFVVVPQLKKLRGVADVDTNGGLLKQIHIHLKPSNLAKFGFSIDHLIAKLETIGEDFGGGYIQRDGRQVIVRATGAINSVESISKIPFGINVGGHSVRIGEVADVRVDGALRLGAATTAGRETVLGTVLMRTGANSREVSTSAEDLLTKRLSLPDDVQIRVLYSRSHLVNATIHTVLKSLIEGVALVVVILLLLLGNLRAALVVAVAIPVSMLFALKGMELFGISANLMSLGAIDFGLLVDGAVVLVENVIRRFEALRGRSIDRAEKWSIVLEASVEVLKPLVTGLFIIMLVYVPILYLEGIEGKMFRPMASTVLLALTGSLLAALFVMPAMVFLFVPTASRHATVPLLFRMILGVYRPALEFSLRRKWIVPLITLIPAALAILAFGRLGSDFVPQLDEGDMVINLTRPKNQGIDESVRRQIEAERIIGKFAEVESVFSRMGTPESALDPMGPYLADTFVILKKDFNQWPEVNGKRRDKVEIFEVIKRELSQAYPSQEISPNQPIEMRFNEILEGSRADVSMRIYGPELDQLFNYSEEAERALKGIAGISAMESDPLTALAKGDTLDVVLDYAKMARYGVSLKGVNSVLETSMSGKVVGSLYEEDRRLPIVVHLDESLRDDVKGIASIPVSLPEGGTIPLSSVASIVEKERITTIARSGGRRYSALSIFLKDRDVGSFVDEAKAKVASALHLKPGYELAWGGQFRNLAEARDRLLIIIPITLVIIFALLLRSFGTFRHALLVFSSIPFAAMGGVFSLYLRGISFSVSAAIGFIALAGIATLNGMVMVSYFSQLRAEGTSIPDTAHGGALARLRPVSMTALVASLGFIPMALNTGTGAEVQRPLATVVIGGIVTSTVLTLIVIPVVYGWLETRFGDSRTSWVGGNSQRGGRSFNSLDGPSGDQV